MVSRRRLAANTLVSSATPTAARFTFMDNSPLLDTLLLPLLPRY